MKYFIFMLLITLISCNGSQSSKRNPSSDQEKLISNILSATNPYEVLGLTPAATITEVTTRSKEIIDQVSRFDLFTLSQIEKELSIEREVTELTEKELYSIKRVLDSKTIIEQIHERKGFKFKIGKFELPLGAKDLEKVRVEELRNIEIFVENQAGRFHVKYGPLSYFPSKIIKNMDDPQSFHMKNNGYLVKFEAIPKSPEFAEEFYRIKNRIAELKHPDNHTLARQMKILPELERLSKRIKEISSAQGSDDAVTDMMFDLSEELKLRYKVSSTPITDVLRGIRGLLPYPSCQKSLEEFI